jgi:hypothetical protein
MNVINDPSIGSLSRSLGAGLGKSLERLAERKYKQIEDRHNIKKATDTGAFDEQTAAFIQSLPEKNRWEAYQALAQERGATPDQMANNGVPTQMSGLQSFGQDVQGNQMMQGMSRQQVPMQPQQQQRLGGTQQQQPQQQQPSFAQRLQGGSSPQKTRNQALIDRQNTPYLKGATKAYEVAQQSEEILNQMEELLNTGKVASGVSGRYAPEWMQSEETQLFDKYSNTLAGLLAQQYGVPTGMKIKFSQSQKPNIGQKAGTQRELIRRLREETQRPLMMNEIREQLISDNGYQQPSNLETRVNQIYNQHRKNPEGMRSREDMMQARQGRQPRELQDEGIVGQGIRGAVRTAARAGEAVAGGVGDIASAALGLTSWATGGKTPTYEEIQSYLPMSAPTSSQIKEKLSQITNGYTDPQGGFEDVLDNVISTAASLFGPGKAKALVGNLAAKAPKAAGAINTAAKVAFPLSGTNDWRKALKLGAAGEVGAQAAAALGGGPIAQSLGKVGLMTAYGISGTRQALKDTMTAEYDAAKKAGGTIIQDASHPGSTSIKADPLLSGVDKLKRGIGTQVGPDKEMINGIITDLEESLKGATETHGIYKTPSLNINQAVDMKKKLNEWVGLGYSPRVPGEKYLPQSARPEVESLNRLLNKEITEYGLKNPEFGKPYALAEELFKGMNTFDKASEYITDKVATLPNLAKTGASLGALQWAVNHPGVVAVGVPGAFAGKMGLELMHLLYKSPKAREVYLRAIENAAKENKAGFMRDLAMLDKEMRESRS